MKYLITSGCSFTAFDICWPTALQKFLKDYKLINVGIGSNSNEMISRNTIIAVKKLLKEGVNPENILVGIMWSGYTRKQFCFDDIDDFDIKTRYPHGKWDVNPYKWYDYNERWLFCTPVMATKNQYIKKYYKNYQNHFLDIIQTYEHVLKTQWYLEKNNIKYFMTSYMAEWNNFIGNREILDDYKSEINFEQWLPVSGEYDWLKENSVNLWRWQEEPGGSPDDHHPSRAQHREFTLKIIIPWLKKKKYV